jgi:AcrR family transcriptional regulator
LVPAVRGGPARLLAQVLQSGQPVDAIGERVLDGALEQFLKFGLRRSTMEDVAKRAGLSRITIYRRFPTKRDLVVAVIMREARRALHAIDSAVAPLSKIEDRFVEGFVVSLRIARDHALLQRLLATEPEMVLPYLTSEAGPVLAVARTFLANHIKRAQDLGAVRRFEPEPVAELLVRLTQSFLLTPEGAIRLDDDRRARAFAREYIAPLLMRQGQSLLPGPGRARRGASSARRDERAD